MKICKKCQVYIMDQTVTCPLCKRVLVEEQESNEGQDALVEFDAYEPLDLLDSVVIDDQQQTHSMYPAIDFDYGRFVFLKKIFFFLLVLLSGVLIYINYITYSGVFWSVIAVLSILYFVAAVSYSIINQANLAAKILVQTIGAAILVVVIDYVIGYRGWSFNYAIPGMILFSNLAISLLVIVNRMNFTSYFMYQIAMTILSFIPLILIFFKWIKYPLLSYATIVISIVILFGTVIFGNKSVKNEIIRRFHS